MIEEEKYIIGNEDNLEPEHGPRFPVKAQLLILGLIITGLFAGIIVPKTMALLDVEKPMEITEVKVENQLASTNTKPPQKIESLQLIGESAFVWDVTEQRILYQKNADAVLPLASITKLMTALVAYELVPDDTVVTVSKDASMQQSGGNLKEGERFKIKDLADFALISSYNSASYTMADSVGKSLGDGDSVVQFVDGMNIRAKELELNSLEFLNPTGLDISDAKAGAFGSARDVSFLVEYILKNHPQILASTILQNARFYNLNGDYHDARNTNSIVYDIPNIRGSKTGYTDLAGGNLTVVFDAGYNRPIIVTVLGSTLNGRFSDVKTMIQAVQDSFVIDEE